jgi:hypothetical protein
MIAAGHFGECCALAPRRIVSGAGTLLPARLTSSGNRHHGMIASIAPPRKCFSRVNANLLPRRCKIAARLEARFGLRVELAENYGAPPDKISRWSGDRWYRNFISGYGITWYHKFDERWHFAWESYVLGQRNVLNATDPAAIIANGGYPFAPGIIQFNAPNFAHCSDPTVLACTARTIASVMYLNYKATPLDNVSLRLEYYHDEQGQRTGTATRYADVGLGLQHWLSPQAELRPEVTYYRSFNAPAFNGNFNATPTPIAPNKSHMWLFAADLILHF